MESATAIRLKTQKDIRNASQIGKNDRSVFQTRVGSIFRGNSGKIFNVIILKNEITTLLLITPLFTVQMDDCRHRGTPASQMLVDLHLKGIKKELVVANS